MDSSNVKLFWKIWISVNTPYAIPYVVWCLPGITAPHVVFLFDPFGVFNREALRAHALRFVRELCLWIIYFPPGVGKWTTCLWTGIPGEKSAKCNTSFPIFVICFSTLNKWSIFLHCAVSLASEHRRCALYSCNQWRTLHCRRMCQLVVLWSLTGLLCVCRQFAL